MNTLHTLAIDKPDAVNLLYLLAAVLFILGLKMLSKVKTARRGNLISSLGMLIAAAVTLFLITGGQLDQPRLDCHRLGDRRGHRPGHGDQGAHDRDAADGRSAQRLRRPRLAAGGVRQLLGKVCAPGCVCRCARRCRLALAAGHRPGDAHRRRHLHRLAHGLRQVARHQVGARSARAVCRAKDSHRRTADLVPGFVVCADRLANAGWAVVAHYHRIAGAGRASGDRHRRRGHAGGHRVAQQLLRSGGSHGGLCAAKLRIDHHRLARRGFRAHPHQHHVQGDEPVAGERAVRWRGRRDRRWWRWQGRRQPGARVYA